MLTVLNLDREAAGKLAVFLYIGRNLLRDRGERCPEALVELQRIAERVVRSAQDEAGVGGQNGELFGAAYARRAERLYLTRQECARTMGISVSSVDRAIRRGEIHAERIGRSVRIPREELNR